MGKRRRMPLWFATAVFFTSAPIEIPPSSMSAMPASEMPCDVDQSFRLLDVFSHQIKEVRAAAEKLSVPTC